MKYVLSVGAILASLLATSALADDGNVPRSTLDALGLRDLVVVSNEDGMQVRGMYGFASTAGTSLVAGLLLDPNTESYVVGFDVNTASASAESTTTISGATHQTTSAVDLSLDVSSGGIVFSGVLTGGAGGSATATPH